MFKVAFLRLLTTPEGEPLGDPIWRLPPSTCCACCTCSRTYMPITAGERELEGGTEGAIMCVDSTPCDRLGDGYKCSSQPLQPGAATGSWQKGIPVCRSCHCLIGLMFNREGRSHTHRHTQREITDMLVIMKCVCLYVNCFDNNSYHLGPWR